MLRRIDMRGRKLTAADSSPRSAGRGYAFPTGPRLFKRRLFSHWREQSAIIRTAADWTVLLYIVIPGGLLGGRFYYGFWSGEVPAWTTALPFVTLLLLLAVLLLTGGMVLLLQEGDLLFLRQRQNWIRSILLRGIFYSLTMTTLKIAAAYAILLPFIIRGYGLSPAAAGALLLLTVTAGWSIKLLGHIVRVQRQGFRRWLRLLPAVTVPAGLYVWLALLWQNSPWLLFAAAAVYAAVTVWALRCRLRLQGTFLSDVREDYKQRMRIAGLLLRGVLDKPRPTRYKPWIFRRSQPLLSSRQPESRFTAAGIKALVRNPAHLKLYLSFSGVSMSALLIAPAFLKWILLIVLALLMCYWLSSFWLLFAGDDYIGILPFTKAQKAAAGSKAMLILAVPYTVLCSAVVCIPLYGWWGLLLFAPLGFGIGTFIARIYSTIRLTEH
ncbi:ABC-2 type transport system permease protein [Paenibacillus sp. PastF-1]|uniref:ABC transporter permease n=2 Tax=unclassified Paenibacillus TaxID=185978 RepID=UPI0024073CDA|nr:MULTISPECIES: ABC transporter permease [unclassified Paenibacillus]MDF9856627.1 ABC-2 type transport system permease protein [Paenibacillus sp. PastF-1]MDH6481896.1 ABC-2 type transport system permease protein [Paenibacillus sp. PastH-2]MDH6509322.1 ABC-2 type transport system permease protein [Paenibacillus sp. PastM-3]